MLPAVDVVNLILSSDVHGIVVAVVVPLVMARAAVFLVTSWTLKLAHPPLVIVLGLRWRFAAGNLAFLHLLPLDNLVRGLGFPLHDDLLRGSLLLDDDGLGGRGALSDDYGLGLRLGPGEVLGGLGVLFERVGAARLRPQVSFDLPLDAHVDFGR